MKKILMMLVVAISIVGCEDSAKKTADKINDEGEQAQTLAKQGVDEYVQVLYAKDLSVMNVEELDATRDKLVSSRTHLSAARAKYKHMLDLDSKNDQVKLIGRDSIEQAIAKIDQINSDIDTRLQNIEVTKKVRLSEEVAPKAEVEAEAS